MDSFKYAKLQGARVLLLGGTSGIGFATAEASIEAGATVVLSSSTHDRLSSAIERLRKAYPKAANTDRDQGYICDLSDPTSLETNIKSLLNQATANGNHKIDHINYTAANAPKLPPLSEYQVSSMKDASSVLRFDALLILCKNCPKYMSPGPRSSITFTSASTATKPVLGRGMLSGLGASTEGLARGLAVDLAPVRVNVVAPGTVDTELLRALTGPDPKAQATFKEMLKNATLLDTVAVPEDVAEAYLYLMKDSNITGSVIHTDGGRLLK